MHRSTVALLRCPKCGSKLDLNTGDGDEIEEGELNCRSCGIDYHIRRGIARFVPESGYADNFGVQWNLFRKTQLDSHSGVPISRDRFLKFTGWGRLDGQTVLDAGCGAGRFAEVALDLGAKVIAVDFSNAIDAAKSNLGDRGNIDFIQADINHLPFAAETFSKIYCLGVIQHTPEPDRSFAALERILAAGGQLALDVYPTTWKNIFFAKYWIRPLTKRLSPATSLRLVNRIFPALYGVSRTLRSVPLVGHYLRYVIPVANYTKVFPLSPSQLREWALLDTYDMWAPAYDQPQSLATVQHWFDPQKYDNVEVFRSGFTVGRGTKRIKS